MRRKFIAAVLVIVMLACCAAVLAACNDDKAVEKTEIVYLGDSIAEGILGASPLGLRHEYAYANVLGRRNDLTYYNHSVSGHLTKDLRAILENEDLDYDMARGLLLHVSEADIIHVSILGNDLLQSMNMNAVVLEAAQDKYDIINGIAATASENIAVIVDRLKELNPDALIIFQNVYNPLSEKSTLVDKPTRATLSAEYGIEEGDLRELGSGILDRLNGVLDNYLKDHPDAFVIADARSEFDRIFEEDYERGKGLIYPDYIHPSNEGHAVLADLTQGILEERGLVDGKKAIAEYKTMRKNVLTNYFAESGADIAAATAAIDAAADCAAVTKAFFAATKGFTPAYNEIDSSYAQQSVRTVDRDMDFEVRWGDSSIWEGADIDVISLASGYADKDKTGVILRTDGTMQIKLVVDASKLNGLLNNIGGGSALAGLLAGLGLDMSSFVTSYLEPIMPGFSFDEDKILGSLQNAYDSLGVRFVSDGDTDAFVKDIARLLSEGVADDDFAIPDGFGIVVESKYTLREVTYPDGTTYTGVYLIPSDPDTQPYLVLSLYKDEGGWQWLNCMVDFIKLDLNLCERY